MWPWTFCPVASLLSRCPGSRFEDAEPQVLLKVLTWPGPSVLDEPKRPGLAGSQADVPLTYFCGMNLLLFRDRGGESRATRVCYAVLTGVSSAVATRWWGLEPSEEPQAQGTVVGPGLGGLTQMGLEQWGHLRSLSLSLHVASLARWLPCT